LQLGTYYRYHALANSENASKRSKGINFVESKIYINIFFNEVNYIGKLIKNFLYDSI